METISITTEIGIIYGRDATIVDKLETSLYPLKLTISGRINGKQCIPPIDEQRILFSLSFTKLETFNCFGLESSLVDKYAKSQFCEVTDSELLSKLSARSIFNPNWKHYIFSTYDQVFEMIAEDYILIFQ